MKELLKLRLAKDGYRVVNTALLVQNQEDMIIDAFINALLDSHDGRADRSNVIGKMAVQVEKLVGNKIKSYNRFGYAKHCHDVAFQIYQHNLDDESRLFIEESVYNGDGHTLIYLRPLFGIDKEMKKAKASKVLTFGKSKATAYRKAQTMGLNWKLFCSYMTDTYVRIIKLPKELYLNMWKNSGEYIDDTHDSLTMKLERAENAVDYILDYVVGEKLVLSPVPDSRSRVAKYRVFFANGEELDPRYAWFINFFSESWRTNLYELWEQEPLDEVGLEVLKVTTSRFWYKQQTSQRVSWKKSLKLFAKNEKKILDACSADRDHGVYYPRMSKLIKAGVGTMTGFMVEADLAASGIGSAAMNIRSLPMAKATSLAGSATPADAHRSIVEEIMRKVIDDEDVIQYWIAKDYKWLKKLNTEITHAQTIPVTAAKWTHKLQEEYKLDVPDVISDMLYDVYSNVMPGLLEWIASVTSITKVGVSKGYPILSWKAPDGVRCSTSAYTKSRKFKAYAYTRTGKLRTIHLQKDMPIEIGPKGIVYDGPDGKLQNKMMGAWANGIQADDAYLKRQITKQCHIQYGFVPFVKHDGYYAHANNIKNMIEIAYYARRSQFELQPLKSGFYQMADFLGLKRLQLKDGDMKIGDFYSSCPSESPLMNT